MSNDQWGLKPIQSPRRNSLTDFFCPNEEWPGKAGWLMKRSSGFATNYIQQTILS